MSEHKKDVIVSMATQQEPLFWYRPVCDGEMYEGPIHNNSVGGKMMRDERPGEWFTLYAGSQVDIAGLIRIAKELRNYSPAGDAYHGAHIHKVWSRNIDACLAAISQQESPLIGEINAARIYIAKLEQAIIERDAMLSKRPCQDSRCLELNAARALLREVLEGERKSILHYEVEKSVRAYLDTCDTLDGK